MNGRIAGLPTARRGCLDDFLDRSDSRYREWSNSRLEILTDSRNLGWFTRLPRFTTRTISPVPNFSLMLIRFFPIRLVLVQGFHSATRN